MQTSRSKIKKETEMEHLVCCKIPVGYIGPAKTFCGIDIVDELKPGIAPKECEDCVLEQEDWATNCPENRIDCPNGW